ncbi:hypothetical protein Aperf_G00000058385 [Anoplocephala perfoliata]
MNNTPITILRRPAQPEPVKDEVEPLPVPTKTLEEKEAHYANVRRRIMGEDYDVNSNNFDESNGDKPAKFDQPKTDQEKTISGEPAPAMCIATDSTMSKKSSPNKTTAVPLMSIPTPALSYRKSLDRSNQVLNFMLSSRQNQMPLLGSPQNLGPHLLANGNSDTPLSRGSASAPKMYGAPDLFNNFAPVPAQTTQQLPSGHSLPTMSHSLDAGAYQFPQQYSNWPMMYPQIPQPGIQFVPPQQQTFLPQSVSGANGVVPAAQYQTFSPAVLQGSAFYNPSVPTTR